MISRFTGKIRQVSSEPVLRSWIIGRVLGRWPGEPDFNVHRPPYLESFLPLLPEIPLQVIAGTVKARPFPTQPFIISLPGENVEIKKSQEAAIFEKIFYDLETSLGLHRFVFIMKIKSDHDIQAVYRLWQIWLKQFIQPDASWVWHPYTASERAVNLIRFFDRHGWPSPIDETLTALSAHAHAIAQNLEYFGDHHTSNHLSNNGRGLFLLGLKLGLNQAARIGAEILIHEAQRIFLKDGMLREGSSHYHLLLTRNYVECALQAEIHKHNLAIPLKKIALKLLKAAAMIPISGYFPLIGDISPDCPPEFLMCLLPEFDKKTGWAGLLNEQELKVLNTLLTSAQSQGPVDTDPSGWRHRNFGPWSGLWHSSPEGWSQMPGHGHQDCGGFVLCFENDPIFIDPGRGGYGETGEAAFYRSGHVHNTLLVNDHDPYPANRPYFNNNFRSRICGPSPQWQDTTNSSVLTFDGFSRLNGVTSVTRTWSFNDNQMNLTDEVGGHGTHSVKRIMITPLTVSANDAGITLTSTKHAFKLTHDGDVSITPITQWTAYGQGQSATAIEISTRSPFPFSGKIKLEVMPKCVD